MSKIIVGMICIVLVLSVVPFALIARSRSKTSVEPAVHVILDMDKQPKFKSQRQNALFADGRVMRPRIEGTIAQQDMMISNEALVDPDTIKLVNGESATIVFKTQEEYDRYMLGQEKGPDGKAHYIAGVPVPVTHDFVLRGQERFNIYCAPCHGASGYGDGSVARRVVQLRESSPDAVGLWTPPTNYHEEKFRDRNDGSIFNTITNGKNSMPRYDKQISVMDRWAIVAYVRALQLSQQTAATLPATMPGTATK